MGQKRFLQKLAISIHALLAESDFRLFFIVFDLFRFLSTLSLRRATIVSVSFRASTTNFYPRSPCGERPVSVWCSCGGVFDFYPRSPCGERQARRASRQQPAGISIHALLAESDPLNQHQAYPQCQFLSTLSLRRATQAKALKVSPLSISIHALLAESD